MFTPGMEVWEAFSVLVPVDFPPARGFVMVQEDYGSPYKSVPPNGVYFRNWDGSGNRWYLDGDYDGATKESQRVWEGPAVTTGVWHDFLIHKRFATDRTGWIEGWFDGQPMTFYNGQTRLTDQQTMLTGATAAGFQLMHYRRAGMFPPDEYPDGLTLYFDDGRVGTSREIVEQDR
jgi:polysaccharide lyase-like protein